MRSISFDSVQEGLDEGGRRLLVRGATPQDEVEGLLRRFWYHDFILRRRRDAGC
jgi:hypothetical protein